MVGILIAISDFMVYNENGNFSQELRIQDELTENLKPKIKSLG